jgi:prophage regulatory protein
MNSLKIIRFPELIELIGLSRARIYQLMADDLFPKPIKLSVRAVGWKQADIQKWLDEREVVSS